MRIRLQWPLVIAPRDSVDEAGAAQADQFGRKLTAYQQYACDKFGSACRIALVVQRPENPRGACEAYHYNSYGTLDWGYLQINTVHLKRAGVNLRDLPDCKANIDFAYQLYTERGFEPWTTFSNGAYRLPEKTLIEVLADGPTRWRPDQKHLQGAYRINLHVAADVRNRNA